MTTQPSKCTWFFTTFWRLQSFSSFLVVGMSDVFSLIRFRLRISSRNPTEVMAVSLVLHIRKKESLPLMWFLFLLEVGHTCFRVGILHNLPQRIVTKKGVRNPHLCFPHHPGWSLQWEQEWAASYRPCHLRMWLRTPPQSGVSAALPGAWCWKTTAAWSLWVRTVSLYA